jgi:outer membrane protein
MRKLLISCFLLLILGIPAQSYALLGLVGVEAAVGGQWHSPSGDVQYDGTPLDLEDTLGYDDEVNYTARVKVNLPLIIPNVYLMSTAVEFEGSGTQGFTFSGVTYDANFDTTMNLTQNDVALFYSIPFLSLATAGMLNAEVGLNVRFMDFELEITETNDLATNASETESFTVPVPMVYAGVQLSPPLLPFDIEAEARVLDYGGDSHYYSFIGRVKAELPIPMPLVSFFVAGGYRHDELVLDDVEDFDAEIVISGPFVEAGFSF